MENRWQNWTTQAATLNIWVRSTDWADHMLATWQHTSVTSSNDGITSESCTTNCIWHKFLRVSEGHSGIMDEKLRIFLRRFETVSCPQLIELLHISSSLICLLVLWSHFFQVTNNSFNLIFFLHENNQITCFPSSKVHHVGAGEVGGGWRKARFQGNVHFFHHGFFLLGKFSVILCL